MIILTLALAVPAATAQASPKTHQLKLTIQDSTIVTQGYGLDNKQITAGLVSGNPFGQGVESISDKVTKATRTKFTLKGTIAIYATHGEMTGAIQFTVAPASNGGATGMGGGTFTAGTGIYKGAQGKFTFTGVEAPHASVFVSHVTGTVAY